MSSSFGSRVLFCLEVISNMDIHAPMIARGSECTVADMNVRIRVSFLSIQVFLNRNS